MVEHRKGKLPANFADQVKQMQTANPTLTRQGVAEHFGIPYIRLLKE